MTTSSPIGILRACSPAITSRASSRRSTSGRGDGYPTARSRAGGSARSGGWIPSAASWAVKQVGDVATRAAELLEGAAFQEAVLAAGIPTPAVRRTRAGEVIADCGGVRVRLHGWVDLHDADPNLDPVAVGQFVAGLHRVDFAGSIGVDPWYTEPVGAARWAELVSALRDRRAPFADELDALLPELVALEAYLGGPPRDLRTCHRDLWADNVRRAQDGGLCVFDFDNAGLADPSQELAAGPRRVRRGAGAGGPHPRRVRGGGRAGARRGPDGLRDGDRAALAHPRRGLPALADGRRPTPNGPTTRAGSASSSTSR